MHSTYIHHSSRLTDRIQCFVEACSARGLTAQSRNRRFFVGLLQRAHHDDEGTTSLKTITFDFSNFDDLGLRAADVLD